MLVYIGVFLPPISSIGLLTLEEENEVGVPRGAVDVFIWLISWMIVFIGALYFIMVSFVAASTEEKSAFMIFNAVL
jgi:hypothetical protein